MQGNTWRTADRRDDALVDVGDEPGGAREEVQDAPDIGEVLHTGGEEDYKVISVYGGAVLDLVQ